jgi:non-ribosomal peptide synthetase component F
MFVSLGDIERAIAAASGREISVRRPAVPRDPCYALCTSGSTAVPKGCVLSYSVAANAVVRTSVATRIDPYSRVMLFANYVFDASVADILSCLCTVGTLCLSSRAKLLTDLEGIIEQRQISHLHLTPSVAQVLPPNSCPSLRAMVLGGELHAARAPSQLGWEAEIVRWLRPSGMCRPSLDHLVSPPSTVGSIRCPLPGNAIFLQDSPGYISRIRSTGEIYIGGRRTFSGYLGEHDALPAPGDQTK